eukprot:7376577-Prymnesium_polylepis.1
MRVVARALRRQPAHARHLRRRQNVGDRHVDREGRAGDGRAPLVGALLERDNRLLDRRALVLVDAGEREDLGRCNRRARAQLPPCLRAIVAPLVLEHLVHELALALRDVHRQPREGERRVRV